MKNLKSHGYPSLTKVEGIKSMQYPSDYHLSFHSTFLFVEELKSQCMGPYIVKIKLMYRKLTVYYIKFGKHKWLIEI